MTFQVLDPTHETAAEGFVPARRLITLDGASVALVSNGKEGTRRFFDAFERALVEAHGVRRVVRLTKTNYSAPAEPGVMARALECDALVAGVGD